MIKWLKYLWFKIKSYFFYKKKLKALRKRDPFIYK